MHRHAPLLSLVSLWWLPVAAAAQTPTALSWVRGPGAESCIGPQELAHAVERHVGPVLVAAPDGKLNVEGRVDRAKGRYAARIVISNAAGEVLGVRELESDGDNCRTLDRQLAFVIAVAIDPDAAIAELPGEFTPTDDEDPGQELLQDLQREPRPPRARSARRPPRASQAAAAKPEPEPEPETHSGRGVALAFGVGGQAGLGVLEAAPSLGLRFDAALEFEHAWLLLDFGLWPSEERELVDRRRTVELDRWDLGASVCPVATAIGYLELDACAGLELSRLHVAPHGFDARAVTRLLWSPRLSGRAAYWLASWFGLSAQLTILRSFPQQRIQYGAFGDVRTAHEVAAVTASVALGVLLRFGS